MHPAAPAISELLHEAADRGVEAADHGLEAANAARHSVPLLPPPTDWIELVG